MTTAAIEVKAGGRAVRVSSPDRVLWPQVGLTKADLAHYWAQLDEVGLRGYRSRPVHLHRFPKGIGGEGFFQKRIPDRRPDWVRRTHIVGPNGTASDALCPTDVAHLVWGVQMGTIEFHPWPTRSWEPDRPDELRVDLDPSPGTVFADVRRAAAATHELLTDVGLAGWPKTSGKRGIHVLVRIAPRWDFVEVRHAGSRSRELERRVRRLSPLRGGRKNGENGSLSTSTRTVAIARCAEHGRHVQLRRPPCRRRFAGTISNISNRVI